MNSGLLHTLLRHPRWKWVSIFVVCEVISLLSLYVNIGASPMSWIGGVTASFFAPGMAVAVLQLAQPRPVFRLESDFVVRRSPWTTLAYLSVCSGWFCGATILLSRRPEVGWIAWALMYLCAFGALLSLLKLLDSRPLIVINNDGVLDRALGGSPIPWSNIAGATVEKVRGTDCIRLALRDHSVLESRTHWQRVAAFFDRVVNLELMHLGVLRLDAAYVDQALDFILARCSTSTVNDPYQELMQLGREL